MTRQRVIDAASAALEAELERLKQETAPPPAAGPFDMALRDRERRDDEVLALYQAGKSDKEIAVATFTSPKAVCVRLTRLRKEGRIGKRTKAQRQKPPRPATVDAAKAAYRQRLIALYNAALPYKDIAEAVGHNLGVVTVEISNLRKKGLIGRRLNRTKQKPIAATVRPVNARPPDATPPQAPQPKISAAEMTEIREQRIGDGTGWTPARLGELDRLWAAGYPITQIGQALGVSRNAVIGKARRRGLATRGSPIVRKADHIAGVSKKVDAPAPKAAPRPHEIAKRTGGDPDDGIPLRGCQYMEGDVPARGSTFQQSQANSHLWRKVKTISFGPAYACWADVPKCGNPRQERSAYCADHHAICWSPAPQEVNTYVGPSPRHARGVRA